VTVFVYQPWFVNFHTQSTPHQLERRVRADVRDEGGDRAVHDVRAGQGTSRMFVTAGKFACTTRSTAGQAPGSHFAARVCSTRCIAIELAASE